MSDGNPTPYSERRANSARRSSRCIFQRPPLGSFTRLEGLKTKAPRTGIIGPGLTGGLAPSTPEPTPSHRPLYLPRNATPRESTSLYRKEQNAVTFGYFLTWHNDCHFGYFLKWLDRCSSARRWCSLLKGSVTSRVSSVNAPSRHYPILSEAIRSELDY
jgi:hypothetical protein